MIPNELILLIHIIVISIGSLISLHLGKEALVAFVSIQMIFANLFVIKQTTFMGFDATTADAFAVGAMIGFNLIQEFFSRSLAQKTMYITLFVSAFYAVVSYIHLLYAPSAIDQSHEYFVPILSYAPKLVAASLTVYYIAQITDFIIYGFLQRVWNSRYITLRNYIAIGISQLVDTILFSAFLWGFGIITNILHVIAVSFTIKFIITLIATPLITIAAQNYKK